MAKKYKTVYIAGALTKLSDLDQKNIYKELGDFFISNDIKPFVPHLEGGDPVNHPEVSAQDIWQKEESILKKTDLLVAYVGEPSLGTGGELEIIRMLKKDIILWWYQGQKVSRFARGNPAVIAQLKVKDKKELLNKLLKIIK